MTTIQDPIAPERRRWRSRRVAAILAGGLVLGIGAAVTLAAWNDSEYATGTFTSGTFNLQGSLDGSTYTDHASVAGAATLSFTVPATLLSPGVSVYAPYAVRLAANTTNTATVSVPAPSTTGATTGLTYSIILPTTFGCTSTTTGTTLVPAGTAVNATSSTTFPLAIGSPVTSAGAAQNICIIVTAGSTLPQTQTGTITWQFLATSS